VHYLLAPHLQSRKALTVFKPLQNRSGNAASRAWAHTVGKGGFMKEQLVPLRNLGVLLVTSLAYAQTIWMVLSAW
jgi:hypothetical protein